MEKQKILDELKEKLDFIKECEEILGSRQKILEIVKTDALNLRDKYADDRRTEISDVAGEVDIEDLIPKEDCVVTMTLIMAILSVSRPMSTLFSTAAVGALRV